MYALSAYQKGNEMRVLYMKENTNIQQQRHIFERTEGG